MDCKGRKITNVDDSEPEKDIAKKLNVTEVGHDMQHKIDTFEARINKQESNWKLLYSYGKNGRENWR